MQNIRIVKFVIEDTQTKIKYNYEETRQGITQINETNTKYQFIAHDNLKTCLENLRIHFGLLTEQIKADSVTNLERGKDLEIIEKIKVVGVEIKETGKDNGVIIIGKRILKDYRTVDFPTPFTNFDSEMSDYPFIEELISDIEDLKAEIVEYINGKFSLAGTQTSITDFMQEAA